jgi:hypothetical protein
MKEIGGSTYSGCQVLEEVFSHFRSILPKVSLLFQTYRRRSIDMTTVYEPTSEHHYDVDVSNYEYSTSPPEDDFSRAYHASHFVSGTAHSYSNARRYTDLYQEVLIVTPGEPTPLQLSIYESKQPSGYLVITSGNQTVEFLDGVVNLPF